MFGLSSGCYFWLPIIEENPNVEPEILESRPSIGDEVVVDLPEVVVFVVVQDENDPEGLEYNWSIDGIGQIPHQTLGGNLTGSMVTLSQLPEYDNRYLHCTVYDSYSASVSVEWLINVEGLQ
jgi:hypothetical protein